MIQVQRDSCQHSIAEVAKVKPWIPTAFFIEVGKLPSYPIHCYLLTTELENVGILAINIYILIHKYVY